LEGFAPPDCVACALTIPDPVSVKGFVYERWFVEKSEHKGLPSVIHKRMIHNVVVGNYQY
jgi:hypothetical protein